MVEVVLVLYKTPETFILEALHRNMVNIFKLKASDVSLKVKLIGGEGHLVRPFVSISGWPQDVPGRIYDTIRSHFEVIEIRIVK